MKSYSVFLIGLLCVSLCFSGCYSSHNLSRSDIVASNDEDIVEVTTTKGEHVILKEVNGRSGIVRDSVIIGLRDDSKLAQIPLSTVDSVKVSSYNAGVTIIATIGIVVGFFGLFVWIGGVSLLN